jgi:hypothetical protein
MGIDRTSDMRLVWPAREYLPGYAAALVANGGFFVEEFVAAPAYGGKREFRYRILL